MEKRLTPQEMAKLTPEERQIIHEEEERRKQEKAKKEAEEKKEDKKKLIGVGIVMLACMSFFIIGAHKENTSRILTNVEKSIEACNFSRARTILEEVITDSGPQQTREENQKKVEEYKKKITQAEITYFIDEGDFSKAYDSAKDGNCIDYYQSTVLNRIPTIYDQKGAVVLAKMLASLVFPSEYSLYYNRFVRDYNSTLTNIISIIEMEGKQDEADLLRKMLKK